MFPSEPWPEGHQSITRGQCGSVARCSIPSPDQSEALGIPAVLPHVLAPDVIEIGVVDGQPKSLAAKTNTLMHQRVDTQCALQPTASTE